MIVSLGKTIHPPWQRIRSWLSSAKGIRADNVFVRCDGRCCYLGIVPLAIAIYHPTLGREWDEGMILCFKELIDDRYSRGGGLVLLSVNHYNFYGFYQCFYLFDGDHTRRWSRPFARMVVTKCVDGRQQTYAA